MDKRTESALRRIESARDQQAQTVAAVRRGQPTAAEHNGERKSARQTFIQSVASERLAAPIALAPALAAPPEAGPERIWGNTIDFVGVAFLERGVRAARTVGRVAWRDGRAQGTGFMIAPGLFLTNNHVLGSPADSHALVVEFDYEIGPDNLRRDVTRFEFSPDEFFITDDTDDLDYTVIAVGRRLTGPEDIAAFGYSPLSESGAKHALGEVANIVQHPDGRLKEVVLRENRLVSRLQHVLHYVADTEPGSSGSPVFNNQWQAIALHHWGGPWRQRFDADGSPVPRFVNEGIRISAIVGELRDRRGELNNGQRDRLDRALALAEGMGTGSPTPPPSPSGDTPQVRIRDDGTAVWRVPIEIAVGVPGTLTGAATADTASASMPAGGVPGSEAFRRKVDKDYDNRSGYRDTFLPGHVVPMPAITSQIEGRMARNLDAEAGDDPFEFKYQHFSAYVDKTRGLPLATACNIDGKDLKSINRNTGAVTNAESLASEPLPEAREKWFLDPRIAAAECGNDDLYISQQVSSGPNRLGRIFHRGHMVRRLDPCWGTEDRALRAEADTFHFTNCTPQIGKFNSGKTLWQGIENHVLDNAKAEDLRVCVFTGTVLDDNDPSYRDHVFPGFKVPLQFWKVVVWESGGQLAALALIADQSDQLDELPEGAEALDDEEGVREFIQTVPDVEALTGLDFGQTIRDADLYERAELAEGGREIRSFGGIRLRRQKRAAKKKATGKQRKA